MGQPRWNTTSDQYLTPTAGDAWADQVAESGQRGTQRILDADTQPAPDGIAQLLDLPAGAAVVRRRRLILADDEPVELATSYWPASLADQTRLALPEKIPGGSARFLAELGYSAAEVRETITARMSTTQEDVALQQRDLRLTDPEPVLELTRILIDQARQPFQVDINVMRAGQRIRYTRQAG
ncbi:GntR family transcriptional regulator [Micromonospora sp. NPDC047762]|uniref:GntR family transcriptional regulator n=1 Tax=Micromonospora sp. NPDC047762 TaxID=3364255 RepID=UPI0037123206